MPHSLAIETFPLVALIPYARNARTHSDAQVGQIAASIREFGFTNPVLVDRGGVLIAGHGRVLAAKLLGMVEVPAIRLGHLTESQARALRLADNQLALNSGWDEEMLRLELGDLRGIGVDLSLLGFGEGDLARLMGGGRGGKTDPDETPEVQATPVSQPLDLWILGGHRIICGSSTDPATVERVLGAVRPHLMVTDPPYGVEYDPAWRNRAGVSTTKRTGVVLNDDRADWREAWALFPGEVAYVWHGALHAATVAESLMASGFEIRSQIIWAKDRLVLGRGHYHWQHEPAWYAVRGKGHWAGDRKQTTLWHIATKGQDSDTVHSTQKPVECMRRPIENNSSPGQAVYEPFSGSGTTIIAAQQTDRCCHAVELNPLYVDVAVRRWQAFTGQVALLDGGGTFAETEAERLKAAA
jgi:DNA modification methylase